MGSCPIDCFHVFYSVCASAGIGHDFKLSNRGEDGVSEFQYLGSARLVVENVVCPLFLLFLWDVKDNVLHLIWVEEFIAFFFRNPRTKKILDMSFLHEMLNVDGVRLFSCEIV